MSLIAVHTPEANYTLNIRVSIMALRHTLYVPPHRVNSGLPTMSCGVLYRCQFCLLSYPSSSSVEKAQHYSMCVK